MRLSLNITDRLSKLIALIFLTAFIGCEENSENSSSYFGGKIMNPKSNHVVLYKNEVVVDTFYLDKNNTFLGEISSLKEGLYYFKHGNEHQYIYLEPKDSVLIRLNTWNFDETLSFSGKGAERNNLLIDSFIESEKDEKDFYAYYDLPPNKFREKVDSTEKIKLDRYNDFVSNHPQETKKYNSVLKMALTYPLYTKVENYPMAHSAKVNDGKHDEINNDFYRHRNEIILDKDSIMYFYAYRDYVVSNLYNKVNTSGLDISSDEFTIDLLKTIASEMKSKDSRNAMLRQTVITHFYRKSSCDVNNDAFDTYLNLSSNQEDKELVTNLLRDVKRIQKGVKIEDFNITDYNKTKRSIKSVIKNKNTVLYFWNSEYMSKDYIADRIKYLSKKHPSVKFVGVKILGDHTDRIYKLDIKSQYYLEVDSKANSFLTSKMPRTILINKKGYVTNAYASLTSRNIYKQIESLTQK